MGTQRPSAFLSLIGVVLFWPLALTEIVSPWQRAAGSSSLTAVQSEERHHVSKRSTQTACSSSFDKYCLNGGQCLFSVDIEEHHCRCVEGYEGNRCEKVQLVVQPMGEEQTIAIIFCVCLMIIGVAGALFFCCKWCKRKRFVVQQKRHGYKGVQSA